MDDWKMRGENGKGNEEGAARVSMSGLFLKGGHDGTKVKPVHKHKDYLEFCLPFEETAKFYRNPLRPSMFYFLPPLFFCSTIYPSLSFSYCLNKHPISLTERYNRREGRDGERNQVANYEMLPEER